MRSREIERLDRELTRLDGRLGGLRRDIEGADSKLRESLLKRLSEAQAKRRLISDRLARLRLADAESWKEADLGYDILSLFDALGRRLNRLISGDHSRRITFKGG